MQLFSKPKNRMKKRFPMLFIVCLAIIAGLLLEGNAPKETAYTNEASSSAAVQKTTSQQYTLARDGLAALSVKGRAPKTGYTRDQFGSGWENNSGCDTRNQILARDLKDVLYEINSCVVLSGILHDPYTDKIIHFQRGSGTSSAVQIDHVVALSDAWQKGAQQLTPALRVQFANDGLNLLAVDGATNQNKGDGDTATWLPPNRDIRCSYVARQISVKLKYSLWITAAEKTAMERVLEGCPRQGLGG